MFLGSREAASISNPGAELQIRGIWTQHSTSIFTLWFPRKQDSGFTSKSRPDVDPFTQPCFELTKTMLRLKFT